MNRRPLQRLAWIGYAVSLATLYAGATLAARAYPGGFDWAYQVMSALASQKHNPDGSLWFASAIALGTACLLPSAFLFYRRADGSRRSRLQRWGVALYSVGVLSGIAVGLERLFIFHLSDVIGKAHEAIAFFAFIGLYTGPIVLIFSRVRGHSTSPWIGYGLLLPLLAIGLSQLYLFVDQIDLGWVDPTWRELGVPVWLSFAFWQWIAVAAIWLSIGYLLASQSRRSPD